MTLRVTGDDKIDGLVRSSPLALLIAMLLDQQISIELAFTGPSRLSDRLSGPLTAANIAETQVDDLVALFAEKPALHRFPASMAKRTHKLCEFVVEHYDGEVSAIWADVDSGSDLLGRLKTLPGFGSEKSKIFVALLAKRFDIKPSGWEAAAGGFSDDVPRSVADVDDPSVLAEIRAYRRRRSEQTKAVNKEH
ncbi:MAG: Fe-S cluster assembly protein HesB [Actinobacteria bacterium]|nr:Fe-S cluster assembly protein HesB [Actinomycetota bacterium]